MSGFDHDGYWIEQGKTYKEIFDSFSPGEKKSYHLQELAVLKVLNQLPAPKRVLEFGCGFGRYTRLLLDALHPEEYVAFDISPDQVARAQALCPEASIFRGSFVDLDPDGEPYDLVFGAEVLLHIPPDDIEDVVWQLMSVTKGHLVHVDAYPPLEDSVHLAFLTDSGYISVSRSRWTYVHPYPAIHKDNYQPCRLPGGRQTIFTVQR